MQLFQFILRIWVFLEFKEPSKGQIQTIEIQIQLQLLQMANV